MLRDTVQSQKPLTALRLSNACARRHVHAYPFFRYHIDDSLTNAAHELVYVPLLLLASCRSSQQKAVHRVRVIFFLTLSTSIPVDTNMLLRAYLHHNAAHTKMP